MVKTKYGMIEGIDRGEYIEYRGIPYAKAPVGELRWKAPEPPEPWEGVLATDDFRNKCVQMNFLAPPYDKDFYSEPAFDRPMSEDCLYLHIWAPKNAKACSVAFWLHGGGFMGGYSSEMEFDGAAYCKRGVLFVSVEYRCNVFGFLAHPWLTAESGTSGNYGTLDQIAALNWVYDNIDAFGGDREAITAFGQSAGAMSVQTLVSSPLTGDKIKRAIMQSGGSYGCGLHRDIPLAEQEQYGQVLTQILGVDSLSDLRAKTTDEILAACAPFMEKMMPVTHGLFLVPVMDGQVLTDGYYALMDQGKIKDIPYLLGSTKDDILVTQEMKGHPEQAPLYRGCIAFSQKLEELGRKPAYVYSFTRDLPGDDFGAWHSAELWYMMGTMDRCWRPWTQEDYALSERMLDYWTNFMRTGDPNGGDLPAWQPCSQTEPTVLELHVPCSK